MSMSSVIRYAIAQDTSSTTGAGKTGLAFGDITAKYLVEGGTLTSLTPETITTLGTYQAPTSNLHIRIKELNSADPTKGAYEVHFHNDQVAVAGKKLWLYLSATGALFEAIELDLADIPGRLPAALTANGNMKSSLMEIIATALTETSGLLAGGFKKFFNVATPTGTLNSIPDTVAGAASGLSIVGSQMDLKDAPNATAITAIQSGLAAASALAALATKFTGITLLAQWLGAMAGKQTPNSTALTEINATGAGSGTYSAITDSTEAIRDRGDAAWTTGGGGSANIVVQPYSHNAPQRTLGTQLTLFLGEFGFQFDTITAYDTQSPPVAINLTGMSLVLRIATHAGVELATPTVDVVSAAAGTWSFVVPATITTALREEEQQLWWSLKDFVALTRDETIGRGRIQVLRRDVTA